MTVIILPSAREDLATGFAFYEEQKQGLGNYFLESLFSDVNSLRLYAGIHRKVFGFYRLLSKRFPYAAYYSIVKETVLIWAILDCRQDPATLRRKLKSF